MSGKIIVFNYYINENLVFTAFILYGHFEIVPNFTIVRIYCKLIVCNADNSKRDAPISQYVDNRGNKVFRYSS